MWKLYLKNNEGIAIQSTFKRLSDCFSEENRDVHIGEVTYIDYENEYIPLGNTFSPFLYKRKPFEHENEIRAIITDFPSNGDSLDYSGIPFDYGDYVNINVDKLIEKIYISPTAPKWVVELVEKILKRYGLEHKEVIQSTLLDKPLY